MTIPSFHAVWSEKVDKERKFLDKHTKGDYGMTSLGSSTTKGWMRPNNVALRTGLGVCNPPYEKDGFGNTIASTTLSSYFSTELGSALSSLKSRTRSSSDLHQRGGGSQDGRALSVCSFNSRRSDRSHRRPASAPRPGISSRPSTGRSHGGLGGRSRSFSAGSTLDWNKFRSQITCLGGLDY
eukprot:TRINITY_DN27666_c0_g2_i1.p1 TRINITY_DN27666_c0_g2~~TRINITY_DN27666_c0_g2_i1.p1  ORF type:complete len:182 (+),score=18.00 TRINITY_DN27666_c0_g2_i1:105-650(+)